MARYIYLWRKIRSFLKARVQIQDFLDNGEARKKQEEAEFARIDAETKDERDKELGLRGKVRSVGSRETVYASDEYVHRFSMSSMVRMDGLPGQNQRLSMVSRIG